MPELVETFTFAATVAPATGHVVQRVRIPDRLADNAPRHPLAQIDRDPDSW